MKQSSLIGSLSFKLLLQMNNLRVPLGLFLLRWREPQGDPKVVHLQEEFEGEKH